MLRLQVEAHALFTWAGTALTYASTAVPHQHALWCLEVLGYGKIWWVIHDDNNIPIDIQMKHSLLIKDLPMRLLSSKQLAWQSGGLCDAFCIGGKQSTLTFGDYI